MGTLDRSEMDFAILEGAGKGDLLTLESPKSVLAIIWWDDVKT
jgi:hypothetical protein